MATDRLSTWLEHLPAVLQEGPFIGRFLLAFEAVLTGLEKATGDEPAGLPPMGIEARLDRIYSYFDPLGDPGRDGVGYLKAPTDFLPWLAEWVATSLREDWDEATKRAFISRIAPLYRRRGTRRGLEDVLRIVVPDVDVIEPEDEKLPPHYFQVVVTVRTRDPILLARRVRMVRALVDREKPAHSIYGLLIQYPAMQINNDPDRNPELGMGLILGADPAVDPNRTTILGTRTA